MGGVASLQKRVNPVRISARASVVYQNVFENELVLRRFLELCDPQDLRRLRLVCKQWYELSLPRWRNEEKVYVRQTYFWTLANLNVEQVSALSELPTLDPNHTYKSYVVEGVELTDGSEECSKFFDVLEKFWSCCGPFMRKLELISCDIKCVKAFWKVLLLPSLEELLLYDVKGDHWSTLKVDETDETKKQLNLKSLSVRGVGERSWDVIQLSWSFLLSSFPNLERLHVGEVYKDHPPHYYETLVDALEQQCNRQIYFGLETYGISDDELPHLKRLFQLPHLKLELLYISEWEPSTRELIDLAFECHSTTLKKFKWHNAPLSLQLDSPLTTPTLVSLRELSFDRCTPDNLHFLEKTPYIRKLQVIVPQNIKSAVTLECVERMQRVNLPFVEVFHFRSSQHNVEMSESETEFFIGLMPNVKELKAPMGANSFPIVCRKWAQLRSLEVTNDNMDDDTFTGMVSGGASRLPNITDLKYLQVLILATDDLTDKSVWNGFLQMSDSVHSLSVTLFYKTRNRAFRELFNRFPSGQVRRENAPTSVSWVIRRRKNKLNEQLHHQAREKCYLPIRSYN